MAVDEYLKWTRLAFRHQPACIVDFLHVLPHTAIPLRKVALAFFRAQVDRLEPRVRFYDRYRSTLLRNIGPRHYRLVDYLTPFCTLHDPLLSGFMAAFTLSAPYHDYQSAEEAIDASIRAEIIAGEEYNIKDLDYRSWFCPEQYWTRDILTTGDPPDIRLSRLISRSFSNVKHSLQGRVLLPKVGVKSIGDRSRRLLDDMRKDLQWIDPLYVHDSETVAGVERLYAKFGIQAEGDTEMRCSWKYNTLKPRTYFAQGPTVYHKAKYVQALFNELVDCVPVTHRRMRFNLPFGRMISDTNTLLLTYDYSAFTSRLTESTRFIEALADYLSGTTVKLVDTFEGIVDADVGDMIREYLQYAQNHPYVDLGRFEGMEGFYHRCGLLGVPGNISSCTLLHGLFLATLVGDLANCKCVGDDALVLLRIPLDNQEDLLQFIARVQTLGQVAEEKFEVWRYQLSGHPYDQLWTYCKRPITRGPDHIIRGELCIVPSVEIAIGLSDEWHVPSPSMGSILQRLLLFQKQLYRLLVKINVSRIVVSELSAQVLANYVNMFMHGVVKEVAPERVGKKMQGPIVVWFGQVPITVLARLRPSDVGEPLDAILLNAKERLPLNFPMPSEAERVPAYGTMVVESHAGLGLLKRLGIIEMKKASYTQWFNPLVLRDRDEFSLSMNQIIRGDFSPTFTVTVLEPIPQWYSELSDCYSTKEKPIVQDHFISGPSDDIPSDEEYHSDDYLVSEGGDDVAWSAGPESAIGMPDTGVTST